MKWLAREERRPAAGKKRTEIKKGQRTASKSSPLFEKMQGQDRLGCESLGSLPERQEDETNDSHNDHRNDVLILPPIRCIGCKCQWYQNQRDSGRQEDQSKHVQIIPSASNHIEGTPSSSRSGLNKVEPSRLSLV